MGCQEQVNTSCSGPHSQQRAKYNSEQEKRCDDEAEELFPS